MCLLHHNMVFFFSHSDLSEQIKLVTKESHTRAENTELMLAYQKGNVSLSQYKVNNLPDSSDHL